MMFSGNKKNKRSLQESNEELFLSVVKNLRMVFDPEIPVNIYDLGLIYNLEIDDDYTVYVTMTLTAPNCPEAETIPGRIQQAVQDADGVEDVDIDLVFDPPWTRKNVNSCSISSWIDIIIMPSEKIILNELSKIIDPDFNRDIVSLGFIKNLSIKEGNVSFQLN